MIWHNERSPNFHGEKDARPGMPRKAPVALAKRIVPLPEARISGRTNLLDQNAPKRLIVVKSRTLPS
jgi:hypothetical protein